VQIYYHLIDAVLISHSINYNHCYAISSNNRLLVGGTHYPALSEGWRYEETRRKPHCRATP